MEQNREEMAMRKLIILIFLTTFNLFGQIDTSRFARLNDLIDSIKTIDTLENVKKIKVTQPTNGATNGFLILRNSDVSPSGALFMGMNAAETDEFWRFTADGGLIIVDEDGNSTLNFVRTDTTVRMDLTNSIAGTKTIGIKRYGDTQFRISLDTDGKLSWDNYGCELYSTATQKLRLNNGTRLSLGVDDNLMTQAINVKGNFKGMNTNADSTIKYSRFVVGHYANSEEDVMVFNLSALSTTNWLQIGGGSSIANTATYISFYTAPDNITLTGEERIRIDGYGNMGFRLTSGITDLVDINGTNGYSQLRLRTSFTPTGTSDSRGETGDVAWDDNYIYVKTSAGWKRAALNTW